MAGRKIRGFRTYMDTPNEAGWRYLSAKDETYCLECAGAYRDGGGDWTDEFGNEVTPVYRHFECVECGDDC